MAAALNSSKIIYKTSRFFVEVLLTKLSC